MKIAILGAGAWGTALAVAASARHEVCLWARDADQVAALQAQRCNQRYLPQVALPVELALTADFSTAVAHARGGLAVIATPMAGLRSTLAALPLELPVWWLCKGFEQGTQRLGHEIAQDVRGHAPGGVLSGPSFALEVALGQPTALVAASANAALCEQAVHAFHGPQLRLYTSDDVIGVEVGGAVKNVLAIATGIADGMAEQGGAGAPGLNARAALITRGLAEMTRLGLALGAQPATFMGLSGLGDLVLTATGALSRNRRVGLLLAAGKSLAAAVAELGHVAEGVYCAQAVLQRAQELGVSMPITERVVAVLQGQVTPQQALWQLMAREARAEGV